MIKVGLLVKSVEFAEIEKARQANETSLRAVCAAKGFDFDVGVVEHHTTLTPDSLRTRAGFRSKVESVWREVCGE